MTALFDRGLFIGFGLGLGPFELVLRLGMGLGQRLGHGLQPFLPGYFILALGHGVNAGQEHGPEAGHNGHGGQRPGGQFGRRHGAQILTHADGLEGHSREVQPVGAAHLVLAVNVVQVAVREGL